MENLELCKSLPFRSAVTESLVFAWDYYPKEVVVSCWMNSEGKFIIDKPVLHGNLSFGGHYQVENTHKPADSYREDEKSQIILNFHAHPGTRYSLKGDPKEWQLSPSINDINFLLYSAEKNRTIATFFSQTYWINPISVIGSPGSEKWALIQIDPVAAYRAAFKSEDFWQKAVWGMYEHYYPRQAKRGTGRIAELFGPARTPSDPMSTILPGSTIQIPKFLLTSIKRYREFMDVADVTWVLVDPLNFQPTPKFSYRIYDIEDEDFDIRDFVFRDSNDKRVSVVYD